MTPADWLVVITGVTLIAGINWYFFMAPRAAATAAVAVGGVQEVPIVVEGGYTPAEVRVRAGRPVRLLFDRRETSPCSEQVALPDFGISRFLPARRITAVEFTPRQAGRFEFTCGMGMLRGRVTVEPAEPAEVASWRA